MFIQSLLVPPALLAPLPAQLAQQMPSEGEVVVDIDRLVAALPFVTRANEKAAIYKRIALLKAKLEAASALLNRPPSVL